MPIEQEPIVSQWYRHLDKGYRFQVTAVEEGEGTVEIQHFDGDLEELDLEDWYELEIEPIEPPEDWTGPVDDIERNDLGYTETDMTSQDWDESLGEAGGARRYDKESEGGAEEE